MTEPAQQPTSQPRPDHWFDAHLDLAFLAETGRDMHVPPADARGRYTPAAVTLPSLRDGAVTGCLATIFTELVPDASAPDAETGSFAYTPDDPASAWMAGQRQLKLYRAWADAGVVELLPPRGQEPDTGARWNDLARSPDAKSPLLLGVLMEGADPIETPDQLDEWADAGVIGLGLTWRHGSRYAGGDAADAHYSGGLTDAGRDLVTRCDARGVVHDLSHLSQQATDELLAHATGPVMASHSNCRALLDGSTERHLADETIAEIGRRGGVIGINLLSVFLKHPIDRQRGERAPIDAVCAHIERIADIQGNRRGIGLGSDMDGGISALGLPQGIDAPAGLGLIAEALAARGWSDSHLAGLMFDNWRLFWSGADSNSS